MADAWKEPKPSGSSQPETPTPARPLCSVNPGQLEDEPVYKDTTFIMDSRSESGSVTAGLAQSCPAPAPAPKTTSSKFFASVSATLANSKGLIMQRNGKNGGSPNSANNNPKAYSNSNYAATVNNVIFSYSRGKHAVNALNDITLKVPVGSIYGILGPSGCGKSTLVHCLVGSLKPKSGYVKVFSEVPGSYKSLVPGPGVGYMPQEIGLFNEFTIKETLFFFGRLYRLKRDYIRDRIAFLVSFLELPDKSSLVAKLSGGQKRRVSLAAALVHNPPLLVLDEPTVGIDPVLRQTIWRHLGSLTHDDGITVIITTHYIDEAQYANTVAFMRNGTLLLEGHPGTLIRRFELKNLEEVFLAVCNNDCKFDLDTYRNDSEKPLLTAHQSAELDTGNVEDFESDEGSDVERQAANRASKVSTVSKQSSTEHTLANKKKGNAIANRLLLKRNKILDHFSRTSALLTKNFIRVWRNLPVLIFSAIIPSIQCVLFFMCLGRDPFDIPLSVYNGETPAQYSKYFLNAIDNHTILQIPVDTIDAGYAAVRSGASKGLIVIPSNYSAALLEKMANLMEVDNVTLQASIIDLYLDMSSQFHANKIREKVFDAYFKSSHDLLVDSQMNPMLANSPINLAPPLLGKANPTVTDFMVPGFITSLAFFSSIATAALTLVLERKDGLLERSLVSGVNPNEYILSHVITQTVMVVFQVISVLLLAFFAFSMPYTGPVFWIIVLLVMQGVCGMAYGILISAVAKEENFTMALCMGSMFPQFLLSGVVWPVETMPKLLMYTSTFLSQAKSIDAIRYMLYRNWDPLHHWDVALGFIITASWTVVFLFIATILFNVNKS